MTDQLTAWIGFLGVALGAAVGFIGTWLTNRVNLRSLREQFQQQRAAAQEALVRERLEELYVNVNDWLNALAANYINLSAVMQGKLRLHEYYELQIKSGENPRHDFSRIEMIVDIYGSELRPAYGQVMTARAKLNELGIRFTKAYDAGQAEGDRFLPHYVQAQQELEAVGEIFKKQIAQVTRGA